MVVVTSPIWRVGAEIDAHKNLIFYGTMVTGYRVGGVIGSQLVANGSTTVYGIETVTESEVGAKLQLLNKRLTLNASLFSMPSSTTTK